MGTDQFATGWVPGWYEAPAANTLADIAINPGSRSVVIHQVQWSYSAAPTGGRLRIQDGATDVFDIDITAGGPGSITFSPPRRCSALSVVTSVLAAGGAGITGKINVNATID
jgi:hypothetical protein